LNRNTEDPTQAQNSAEIEIDAFLNQMKHDETVDSLLFKINNKFRLKKRFQNYRAR
jgi:hypothetical protein